MSKFIDNVKIALTGNKKYNTWDNKLRISYDIKEPEIYTNYLYEYKVEVAWRTKVYCKQKEELQLSLDSVIIQLHEAIYGDFREHCINLYRHICVYDRDNAMNEIQKIMKEING